MKQKVIEACGRVWHELGVRGSASASDLANSLGEDEGIVNLALGWLAREDKVDCSKKNSALMFQLVDSEMQTFREFYKNGRPKTNKSFWKKLFR
jgi:hypothetical protein